MNAVVTLPEKATKCGLSALLLHWNYSSWLIISSANRYALRFDRYAGVCLASPVAPSLMSQGAIALRNVRPVCRANFRIVKKQATCCPPLANFAQLSMFRFDGVIKHHVDLLVNTMWILFVYLSFCC